MAIFCASCAPADHAAALRPAASDQASAQPVVLPALPSACRAKIRSGVQIGDRLDVALRKTDNALARQHTRVDGCAAWFDELRDALAGADPDG